MNPTVEDLIKKGYLHDHTIPPLTTEPLAAAYLAYFPEEPDDPFYSTPQGFSRCVTHSVPKRRHSRRILSIPNPQHQIPLCIKLVEHWALIERHCSSSLFSLTTP